MTNIIISSVVAGIVALGAVAFFNQEPQLPPSGALSGPDIASPYISVGGLREWSYTTNFASATSTVCSFATPAATSTIVSATGYLTPSLGYTTGWLWGTSTSPAATTTPISSFISISNGAEYGDIIASTTQGTQAAALDKPWIVRPNIYVNLKLSTSSASALFAPTGVCHIKFRELF